jgi:hypothetical protein
MAGGALGGGARGRCSERTCFSILRGVTFWRQNAEANENAGIGKNAGVGQNLRELPKFPYLT